MSRNASITMRWADGTYPFRLPIGQLCELQEKTGAGPLQVCRRIIDGTWRVGDLYETLRLGLIGGGMEPTAASFLADRYVAGRPWAESLEPALAVLSAAIYGPKDEPLGKQEPAESPEATTSASASPAFTQ